jgi:hypothetical protein
MRVWHLPARRLPVPTRPIAGETIPSYAHRLGAANDLPGTTMLRALGDFNGKGSETSLLTGYEAQFNEHAAARLEEYTGRPRDHLARVLPGLRGTYPGKPLPPDRPALSFHVAHTRPACRPLPAGRIRPVRSRRPDPARLDASRLPPPPALARP